MTINVSRLSGDVFQIALNDAPVACALGYANADATAWQVELQSYGCRLPAIAPNFDGAENSDCGGSY
jgi:hypothetical protein